MKCVPGFWFIWLCFLPTLVVHAQEPERRLEQYRCGLRLPSADFNWLAEADLPGATLACRDPDDRFVILLVREAPPGYFLDARQAAGFEEGMARNPGIERLGARFLEFLGVPCYEMRGRIRQNQSLTVTRMFVANGFLYDLQAMIPAPTDPANASFDDLLAGFQFIGTPVVPRAGTGTGTAAPGVPGGSAMATGPVEPATVSDLPGDAPTGAAVGAGADAEGAGVGEVWPGGGVAEPAAEPGGLAVPGLAAPPVAERPAHGLSYRLGQLAGVSLLGAIGLVVVIRVLDQRGRRR